MLAVQNLKSGTGRLVSFELWATVFWHFFNPLSVEKEGSFNSMRNCQRIFSAPILQF
jgi:hypothetical protein